MPIEQLYQRINQLSDEVEQLINAKNEQACAALLTQRLSLLEQLAENVAELSDVEAAQQKKRSFFAFLETIQARDEKYQNRVQKEQTELFTKFASQVKNTKAIKAYHNLL